MTQALWVASVIYLTACTFSIAIFATRLEWLPAIGCKVLGFKDGTTLSWYNLIFYVLLCLTPFVNFLIILLFVADAIAESKIAEFFSNLDDTLQQQITKKHIPGE